LDDIKSPFAGLLDNAPVPRSDTQDKLDKRAMASRSVSPSQMYSIADRLEAQAKVQGEAPCFVFKGKNITNTADK
jgi:fatty-acyl-CoA synthase